MKPIALFCLAFPLVFTTVGCPGKPTKSPELAKQIKSLHETPADRDLKKQMDIPLQSQTTQHVEKYIYKQTPQGELAIHIHFPKDWTANDKRPAIVFFFGGGWRIGSIKEFTLQAEYLASRGMVTARADYRVSSRHGTTADKCVEDGKSTVRWLRANAAKLGIDPNRIAASGHSAGGHIAACTYTTKGLEAEGEDLSVSSKPNLLVLFSACLDYARFGWDVRWKEMAIKISPNHNLTKDVPPTILFCGTEAGEVLGGVDFIKKTKELGNIAQLYVAEGQLHGFCKRSPWLERTIYLMDKFLTRYGYIQGKPTIKLPEGKVGMKKMFAINLYAYAEDKWGYTPLHRAAWHCDKELVELLIANGADVNAKDKGGYAPLHYAIWYGYKDMIRLLVDKGADLNVMPNNPGTPLEWAVWNEDVELAKLLVDKGAKFNVKDQDGWTALRYVVAGGNRELLEFLVVKGANVSDFHMAAWLGDLTRVKRFVEQGTDVNAKDDELKWTALHWIGFTGHQDVAEFLLANGASVNAKDDFRGSTPLHYAAGAGERELVELLLAKGTDVNARNDFGKTPLHDASKQGHREVAALLIAGGADVNAKDRQGRTALWLANHDRWASRGGFTEIVELLLKHGAKE